MLADLPVLSCQQDRGGAEKPLSAAVARSSVEETRKKSLRKPAEGQQKVLQGALSHITHIQVGTYIHAQREDKVQYIRS